jgi:hypothetical protein
LRLPPPSLARATAMVLLCAAGCCSMPAAFSAQADQTPYEATKIIWRWRAVMNLALEDDRAFAAEEVIDLLEEFVSPGAVRVVRDKADEEQLKKADAVLQRFVDAMVAAGKRQPDGSVIVEADAIEPAVRSICPVYPFCDARK